MGGWRDGTGEGRDGIEMENYTEETGREEGKEKRREEREGVR